MSFRFAICGSLIGSLTWAAPVPKELQTPTDHESILGTWEVLRREHDGKSAPVARGGFCKFSKDSCSISMFENQLQIAG